ncbi:MAG: AI-2E family transporter [Desulfuromonas sp.]|uniref:AI-2E family transporter n=1 Tax=Desulfuromonas sp. TaxID=892 RepID=UPI000CB46813|nr:AI-2E family transporter [Desulfuromonas sp.]PLX85377.1 MAG: AI-2E family transporter [Desulfuromonas sp.]
MITPPASPQRGLTKAQVLLIFLVLTAAIATGLSIFSSASTVISLFRTATAGLFLPILLSLIMTFLLDPIVSFIERGEIRRTTCIFIVYFLIALLLYFAANWFAPHWQQMWGSLKTDMPRYLSRMVMFLNEAQTNLQSRFPIIEHYDLPGRARQLAEQFLAQILVQTPKSALRIGTLMILGPLFTFFFLRDGHRTMRAFIGLVPNRYFEMAHDLYYNVSRQMAHFIRGRILEAFIIGMVVTAGLSLTDIGYAPILGLFAGITNLVPYIGPIVGMIPGILIALVDLGMGGQFWWIVIVYVLLAQVVIDNFLLIPILISRVSNLHPLWVILAIIMGGKLYGVLGMIIGVPVASIIKIAILETRHYRRTFTLPGAVQDNDQPTA